MLTSKRLLFVDDEPAIRQTLSIILQRYGFLVTVAASVSDAIEHIKNHSFDILLCDLNIEREGDGYEVVRAMRDINPQCVLIVLTGFPTVETEAEGVQLSIDDYLIKPVNSDMLVALLADKLAEKRKRANDIGH